MLGPPCRHLASSAKGDNPRLAIWTGHAAAVRLVQNRIVCNSTTARLPAGNHRAVLSGPCGDRRIEEAVDFPDLFGTEAKFSRANYSRNLFGAAKANNGGGHGGVP